MKKLLPGISVAVITRNRARKLQDCLGALNSQTLVPYEVLVIDNASEDETKKIAESFEEKMSVRYFYEEKIGIPFARNRALQEAKTEILAFTDDDCRPTRHWLEEMYLAHQRFTEETAIQGESFSSEDVLGIISTASHEFTIRRHKDNKNLLSYLDTKNVSLKMKTILTKKILFDTDFPRGSDSDFGKRLLFNKEKIIFYPRAKVFFDARGDPFSFLRQRFRWGRSNVKIESKWPKKYFPSNHVDGKKYRFLHHSLVKQYWYKTPLLLALFGLARIADKLGRFAGHREIAYQKLGYGSHPPHLKRGKKPPSLKTVSVAIITKDRPQYVKRCLESLLRQTRKPDEVVIIDSSAEFQTKNIIDSFTKGLEITFVQQEPLGRGVARNTALSKAQGDIVAFIDDDLEAKPDWLEQVFLGHNHHRGSVAIQGKIISHQNSPWALAEQFRMDRWFIEKTREGNCMQIITTKNVSFKRHGLLNLGVKFAEHPNPKFANLIGEDVDFAKQLLSLGGTIKYLPSAVVYHWERPSLVEFFKQQHRKGYSYGLVKKKWPQYYPPVLSASGILDFFKTRFLMPFLEMLFHPVLGKYKAKLPFVLIFYYLSVFAYFKGYRDSLVENQWQPQYILRRNPGRVAKDVVVAVVTRNKAGSLRRCLHSLAKLEMSPSQVIIVDNGSTDFTANVVDFFRPYLPIRYLFEPQIGVALARNRVLAEVQAKILIFTDDDCEVAPNWLGQMLFAHQKYPSAAAVQGWAESIPVSSLLSIVIRFKRQTWIRDNMVTDRNLFWRLIQGKISEYVPLLCCDTRNISFKARVLQKYKLRFDEILESKGDDYDFAKQLIHHKQVIVFYPQARVYHHERTNIFALIESSLRQGQASKYLFLKWPRKYFPPRERKKGFFKKLATFSYFCIVNRYFPKLPILLIIFFLSELAYLWGKNYGANIIQQYYFSQRAATSRAEPIP